LEPWGNSDLPPGQALSGGRLYRLSLPLVSRRDHGSTAPRSSPLDQGDIGDQPEDQLGGRRGAPCSWRAAISDAGTEIVWPWERVSRTVAAKRPGRTEPHPSGAGRSTGARTGKELVAVCGSVPFASWFCSVCFAPSHGVSGLTLRSGGWAGLGWTGLVWAGLKGDQKGVRHFGRGISGCVAPNFVGGRRTGRRGLEPDVAVSARLGCDRGGRFLRKRSRQAAFVRAKIHGYPGSGTRSRERRRWGRKGERTICPAT